MHHKPLSSRIKRLLDELDWDCEDNLHQKTSLNILHWYPASFITAIPGNVIDIFTEPGDVIWDPFCGCGTTALEAFRKGRTFYGNDICEIAVLISQAKLSLLKYRDSLDKEFDRIISELSELDVTLSFNIPNNDLIEIAKKNTSYDSLLPWYNEETLCSLLRLKGFLESYNYGKQFKIVFLVAFLNIAKLACAQQKTYGHIADNVYPDKDQISSNNYNVIDKYIKRLYQIQDKVKKIIITSDDSPKYQIKMEDAKVATPPKLVDIIITSPPYPSMADYITAQRLDYYWLGYTIDDINKFKKLEIGARHLRGNNKKNELYLTNIKLCFENIIKSLKEDGLLVLVLPEYESKDARKDVLTELYNYLSKIINLKYDIRRNIDDKSRSMPFKSLKKEKLSIWGKK